MANLIGQKIDKYTIVGALGEGGMAMVYRALQAPIDREVAFKVISERRASDPEFIQRFELEARTIAKLDHPYILKMFDYGHREDLLYFVTELKSGTVAQLLNGYPLPPTQVSKLLSQIAAALDYGHQQGVIHRDIKPQNVLLDAAGNAFLTDFGIAKIVDNSAGLTNAGVAMGTAKYMAPERWQGLPADPRSDLYSLGVMLYQMLSGVLPFQADTDASLMFKIMRDQPTSILTHRRDLPTSVDMVLFKALAKDPDERYQSGRELSQAFKEAINAEATGTGTSGRPVSDTIFTTGPVMMPPVPPSASAAAIPSAKPSPMAASSDPNATMPPGTFSAQTFNPPPAQPPAAQPPAYQPRSQPAAPPPPARSLAQAPSMTEPVNISRTAEAQPAQTSIVPFIIGGAVAAVAVIALILLILSNANNLSSANLPTPTIANTTAIATDGSGGLVVITPSLDPTSASLVLTATALADSVNPTLTAAAVGATNAVVSSANTATALASKSVAGATTAVPSVQAPTDSPTDKPTDAQPAGPTIDPVVANAMATITAAAINSAATAGTTIAQASPTVTDGTVADGTAVALASSATPAGGLVVVPSDTPKPTATATASPTKRPTNTVTPSPTATHTATLTPTPLPTETPTATLTETPTETPTETSTATDTPTATLTPTETPTATFTPSETPTETATSTPTETRTPTWTPTATWTPSNTPTDTPTPTNTRRAATADRGCSPTGTNLVDIDIRNNTGQFINILTLNSKAGCSEQFRFQINPGATKRLGVNPGTRWLARYAVGDTRRIGAIRRAGTANQSVTINN